MLLLALGAWTMGVPAVLGNVTARYVRLDNPTGMKMTPKEIEVISGGSNIVLGQPNLFTGTPNTTIAHEAGRLVDGGKDPSWNGAAADFNTYASNTINPWLEIDLGSAKDISQVILYGNAYTHPPKPIYLDPGDRVLTLLDANRNVLYAVKWNYYDYTTYPDGIFTFNPVSQSGGLTTTSVPVGAQTWIPMTWLLDSVGSRTALPDATRRNDLFANRNSSAEIKKLADRLFGMLNTDVAELATARSLYAAGSYQAALDAWKTYWFAKMATANLHMQLGSGLYTYGDANAADLLNGLMVTMNGVSVTSFNFTPGTIPWSNNIYGTPSAADLDDSAAKSCVGDAFAPLLTAYQHNGNSDYLQRWCDMMDDWCLFFFKDTWQSPLEAEALFTYTQGLAWNRVMEDLANTAAAQPDTVDHISSATLARMQITCLEKFSTAWWRQARSCVFNHVVGGIGTYRGIFPYIDEFGPGRQLKNEWQQAFERWITLGNEPDGSMTEIGDEGHFEIPMELGSCLTGLDQTMPSWYTPGWRNCALNWYDGMFKYMFRHLTQGGYEHRMACNYRPQRWYDTTHYFAERTQLPPAINRDSVIFAIPEVRRLLDVYGHISAGRPTTGNPAFATVVASQDAAYDRILQMLGDDEPGLPVINSDYMPYTGAYYLRSGWQDNGAFLAMMACGSHGGSQVGQWPHGMFYVYDYNYPLMRVMPTNLDNMPPQEMYGRTNCYQPGTKTTAIAGAEQKPAQNRWLSSAHFDFAEDVFTGFYQKYPGFQFNWDNTLNIVPQTTSVATTTTKEILQLRDSRLFIVTEKMAVTGSHNYSTPLNFQLSATNSASYSRVDQLVLDGTNKKISTIGRAGPSLNLYQCTAAPITYSLSGTAAPGNAFFPRLGSTAIASQAVNATFSSNGPITVVNVISSIPNGGADRIASLTQMNQGNDVSGFHATLVDGGEVWYQTIASGVSNYTFATTTGTVTGTAQGLLVTTATNGDIRGILIGGQSLSIDGTAVTLATPDFEFYRPSGGSTVTVATIYKPIDPVSFSPNIDTFTDTASVQMTSATPNVEIHYTTDGTEPTLSSPTYSGPIQISQSTEFAARAYRLEGGTPMPADDFEINGTKFTVPTYAFFKKKALVPADPTSIGTLVQGLNYDYLQGPWWTLFASAHYLPAEGSGTVAREMDLSMVTRGANPYGMRYRGYINVPESGVYTFQAPTEMSYMDEVPSYDLRLFIDGQEWYLTQWWHAHGTWSVPLSSGLHQFEVTFADARVTPWRKTGMWRYFPRRWSEHVGNPSDILVSGPGLDHERIPQSWFYRKPEPRTYGSERTVLNANTGLNVAADGVANGTLSNVHQISFKTNGNFATIFGGLVFTKTDNSTQTFAQLTTGLTASNGVLTVDLNGLYESVSGSLTPAVGLTASLTVNAGAANNPPVLAAIPATTGTQGSLITFTAAATDADSQTLTYSLGAGAPSGASINASSGVFTWTPSASGNYTVTVIATDTLGASAWQAVSVVANSAVNTPPIMESLPDRLAVVGQALSFNILAADDDLPAQTLHYGIDSGISGMSVNSSTGVVSWTPSAGQAGTTTPITVKVTDNGSPAKSDFKTFTVKVAMQSAGTGTGLSGEYFDNIDLTSKALARTDASVNFNWGSGSPDAAVAASTYSARWTGQVQPLYTETYTFYASVDDGVRLWVNGQLLVDQWTSTTATEWSGSIALAAGQRYDICMEYCHDTGSASAALSWSSASQAKGIVPQAQLYPKGNGFGLIQQSFGNVDFTGVKVVRMEPVLDHNYVGGSPDALIPADNFSSRWLGQLQPLYSDIYTIYCSTGDGGRLWVNGVQLVNKWVPQGETEWSGTMALVAGQKYDICMEHYDATGSAQARLRWSSSSQTKVAIPQSQLYPSTTLPSPWVSQDIGGPAMFGSVAYDGSLGLFMIRGSGTDIGGSSDQFQFMNQSASADCEIVSRIDLLQSPDASAKAGVMIRETTNNDAMFAMVAQTPDNQVTFQWRNSTGGTVSASASVGGTESPKYVKLVRSGNVFSAYYKVNSGDAWLPIGTAQTITMASATQMGLAVTAHDAKVMGTGVFSNTVVTP